MNQGATMKNFAIATALVLLAQTSFAAETRTIDGEKGYDIQQGLIELSAVSDCEEDTCKYTLTNVNCSYDADASPSGGRMIHVSADNSVGQHVDMYEYPDDDEKLCSGKEINDENCHYGQISLIQRMIEENLLKDGDSHTTRLLWAQLNKIECTSSDYNSASCTFEYK